MQIQVFTPDDAGWKESLTRLTHEIYHTPAYALIEARRLQAMPEAILVSDGEQQLFLPYLLRSCDSMFMGLHDTVRDVVSAYGYPGILLSKQGRNQQFATAAWQLICEHMIAQNVCTAFLRMHPILGEGIEQFLPPGILQETGPTVAVELQLEEDVLHSQIAKNHRRTIAKSQNLGFTARIVKLNEVLESFIDIYTQTMDRVNAQGRYYFDQAYFQSLAEMPGIHCCVVESGSRIIAVCIIFESGGIVQYHLGGTATDYYANSPFHLCLFHVLWWAKDRGNQWVHLGGGVGGENDQLLRFKVGFSPRRFQYQTARVVFENSLYRKLVDSAAAAMNCPAEELLKSNFFPAYRSPHLEKV